MAFVNRAGHFFFRRSISCQVPSIRDVVCTIVAQMKVKANDPEEGDEDDVLCCACRDDASCVFWTWCDTCKEDTCSEHPDNKCKSYSKNFTMFVRRSDNFLYHNLQWTLP